MKQKTFFKLQKLTVFITIEQWYIYFSVFLVFFEVFKIKGSAPTGVEKSKLQLEF